MLTNIVLSLLIGAVSTAIVLSEDSEVEKLNMELDEKNKLIERNADLYNQLVDKITSGDIDEDDLEDIDLPNEDEDEEPEGFISDVDSSDDMPEFGWFPSEVVELASKANTALESLMDAIEDRDMTKLDDATTKAFNDIAMYTTAYQVQAFEYIEDFYSKITYDLQDLKSINPRNKDINKLKDICTDAISALIDKADELRFPDEFMDAAVEAFNSENPPSMKVKVHHKLEDNDDNKPNEHG